MDFSKGLLVPVNYGGQWEKGSDGCWSYDGLFTRYVRVRQSTTYLELIEKICAEIGINKDDTIVDVKGWMSFPVKNALPPFILMKNIDISTFIELNQAKDFTAPLCITTSPKPKVVVAPSPQVEAEKKKVEAEKLMVAFRVEENQDTFGLDDIKLTNPVDNVGGSGDYAYSMHKHDVEEEEEDSCDNDAFDNDEPFNHACDDDPYDQQNPFDCVYNGSFDPYFGVFVESHNDDHNDGNTQKTETVQENGPPAASSPPLNVQSNSLFFNGIFPYTSIYPNIFVESHNDDHIDGNTQKSETVHENGAPAASSLPLTVQSNLSIFTGNHNSATQSTNVNVHVLKDFRVGELVEDKRELLLRLRIITVKANREFQITHSNRSRVIARCIEKSCSWRLKALVGKKHGSWVIRSYIKEHSCSIDARFRRTRGAATSEVIAQMVKDDNNNPGDIAKMLEKVYGIKITYWRAWKAKEIATQLIRGNPEASFMGLPSYLWLLENANPGTYSAYQLDVNNSFVHCFLSFGPSIAGFISSIRPVIAVDACFLKGRYRGKLFIATCMDGNNQIYPLAFAVGATENDATWSWFFQQLHHVVGSIDGLVFISDRHPSIEKCCMEQFPEAVYGICMFHLGLNMNARYKVKATEFLYSVAKAYTEVEFEEKFRKVRSTKRQVYDYLMDADPRKWARCFFPARRYSIMTTNIAESMNALLKEAREFPIIALLETIRTKLQGWFHDRLRIANNCTTTLTPYAERKMGKRDDKSRHFTVHPIDEFRFYILDGQRDATVDINLRTCTCNKFQLNQLPCSHAIRACRMRNISAYAVCSRFYTNECLKVSYNLPLNPVPHRSEWYRIVPQEVQDVVVRPPVVTNKKGRRKNKRIPSQGEETLSFRRCSRCREPGHNKQTCKGKEYVSSQVE